MVTMTRRAYAEMFGPTTGDCVRLGDSSLLAEVEHDYLRPGDECLTGGGKTVRDGMAMSTATNAEGALDLVFENALIIDPVLGVVKADIGVKDQRIVGIGKAGNPATLEGVDPNLVIGNSTVVECCEGMIVTPGGIDVHVHFMGADQCLHALSNGITTLIGGGLPSAFAVECGSAIDIARMLHASEGFPVNFGFFSRGNSHRPEAVSELISAGVIGVKIHEDFGAMPATIDGCLSVADELDFQVQLHTDTLNESGFYEQTIEAIAGRTIHMYHTEGAGGGHAPDIIRCNGEPNCLPSSTNPTNPYTVNTFDEHLDMTMASHFLRPDIPEDVAHAESRIRRQSISAEDVMHDIGAISMMGSDSQGMGRVNETVTRTWQTASKMRDQRGRFANETVARGDNERIKRYIAKYTINSARTFGIDAHIGSIEPGKLADLVVWDPRYFGIKPSTVYKCGFVGWAKMGDGAACLSSCQPVAMRHQWASFGSAPSTCSVNFVHPSAFDNNLPDRLSLQKPLLPLHGTRNLSKRDMLHNDVCPRIEVNAQTFDVYVDDELAVCDPVDQLCLSQRYMLR
ncbi:MAG: urease subunit alpha [Thiotrichales bacterium]|nr:urease subunit alpha [Thiotrichales bacterium]